MIPPARQLFCYGTLRHPEVMRKVIGWLPPCIDGSLSGYQAVRVKGQVYPTLVTAPDAQVSGVIYRNLTNRDILLLDRFEGRLYRRETLTIQSSKKALSAWVYVIPTHKATFITDEMWDYDVFCKTNLKTFLL